MPLATRPAVLLATASVAASLLVAPGTARAADTTTTLTAAQMRTALRTVGTASTSAGAGGWRAVTDFSLTTAGETMTIKDTVVVDPVSGRFGEVTAVSGYGTEASFAAEGRGVWTQADTEQVKALRMMGRSAVKYVFAADRKLRLAELVRDSTFDSASLVEYYAVPGTRTIHDDGTIDYRVTENDQKVTVVIHTSGSSVLTGVEMTSNASRTTIGFTYAAQTVTLPAAAEALDAATVGKGVAYLDMAGHVQLAVQKGAASTRKAAKGRTVKVATLRKRVAAEVAAVNRAAGADVVRVKDVPGGVRVHAANPWTKKSVTYSVTASGRKVVVRKR